MNLRPRALVLLIGATFTAAPTLANPAGASAQQAPPSPRPAAAVAPFTPSWTRQVAPGAAISTSSPVLVDNNGDPFVAVGDNGGRIRAYDLDDGAPKPGWGATGVGFGVRAPLSSDGNNVYVPVAVDGIDRYAQFKKFNATGGLVWNSNPGTAIPSNPGIGFLLSGVALSRVSGNWQGYSGSSSQWVHGINGATGAQNWAFRNADSTMATPAVADLYGTGTAQIVMSTDTTAEFFGDRHGGLLRIFTHDGQQICTATQTVTGDRFAASGYNNSSPAIATIDGRPLIAFGSTGPVQYGAGGNQVVGYDADCRIRWATPDLGGQAAPSPSFADVLGRGVPDVVQMVTQTDGPYTYPRVYVINSSTGAIVGDTRANLRGYGGLLAYPETIQITTADLNADGAQDLFVPAREGSFLVLDGRTLSVLATIPTNMAIQNTPIVTATANGVRVTVAGYNGLGAQVSSYVSNGGTLGQRGWHHFGGNPQLTGTQGVVTGPSASLLEGTGLGPGQALRRNGWTALMQTDGNFVVWAPGNVPVWSTGTRVNGSSVVLTLDGSLEVRAPGGGLLWRWQNQGLGIERMDLGPDGVLRIVNENPLWDTSRRLNTARVVWTSSEGGLRRDLLRPGETLMAGQHLVSADGSSVAFFQSDGNLTIWRRGALIWQSHSHDYTGRATLRMQGDGNLVVWDFSPWPIYLTRPGGAYAIVTNEGALRVVAGNGAVLWSSDTPPPRVK